MRHPPPFLLYIVGLLGAAIHKDFLLPRRSPASLHLLSSAVLSKVLPDHHKLHHRHAAMLLLELFPNLSSSLAGSRHWRRHRAARVLNAEEPLFGA